jgi:hypothetical protein
MLTKVGEIIEYHSFADFCQGTAQQLDQFYTELAARDVCKALAFRQMLLGTVMRWLEESNSLH